MAIKVPIVQSQRQLPGQIGGPRATPDDFGADVARGLGDVGTAIAQRQEQRRKEADRLFLMDSRADVENQLRTDLISAKGLQGRDSLNLTQIETERLSPLREQFVARADTPTRQAMLGELWDTKTSSYLDRVATHEATQFKNYRTEAEDKNIFSTTQGVIDSPLGDFTSFEEARSRILSEIPDAEKAQGAIDTMAAELFDTWALEDADEAHKLFVEREEDLKDRLGVKFNDIKQDVFTAKKASIVRKEKLETEGRRLLKESQIETFSELTADLGEGKPIQVTGPNGLNTLLRQSKINVKQYDALVEKIQSPVEVSDSGVFQFIDDIILEDPQLITADDIYTTQHLKASDQTTLVRRLDKAQDAKFSADYKKGGSELKAVIKTTGPAAQLTKVSEEEKITSARAELFDRLSDGENLNEIIKDMKPRYRTKKPTIASLPGTRFVPKPTSLSSVASSQEVLARKIRDGEILDINAAKREAELLEQYEDIYLTESNKDTL